MSRLIELGANYILIVIIAVTVASCKKAPEDAILGQWQSVRTNYVLEFYSGGTARFHNPRSSFVMPLKWSILDDNMSFEFENGSIGRGGFTLHDDRLEITNLSIHGNDFNGEYRRQK